MVRRMMLTALEGIPSVMPGDDLAVLVVEACKRSDLALAGRLALPVTAFLPDLETTLASFGEEIIRPYANA
jgi:hypothetical protein